jgi:hypothetical protein
VAGEWRGGGVGGGTAEHIYVYIYNMH